MEETINILFGSDINYAPYYGVMLSSLLRHNKESRFDVYLLTDSSWTVQQNSKFEKLTKKYNSEFHVVKVDEEQMQICPLNPENHVARTTYYRLMAGKLLPDTIDKILYFDGDMVVLGDIRELWNFDMTNYAIAGAIDSLQFDDETYERLDFDKKYGYINVGTELMNLKYLRENHIAEKSLDYIVKHPGILPLMDQDVINTLVADKKAFIPITFNYQVTYLMSYFYKTFPQTFKDEVLKNSNNPIIVHYNGGVKPWQWRYYGLPYKKLWDEEYKASPWCCARMNKPWTKYIKHLIKRVVRKKALLSAQRKQYIPESADCKFE